MFPNLYYLVEYLFGWHIEFLKFFQTFGFFVAIAFLGAYWAFVQEFKRKEKLGVIHPVEKEITVGAKITTGELAGNGVFGFILFYKLVDVILNFHVAIEDPGGFILSTHGNWIAGILGGAAFAYWAYAENQKQVLPEPKQRKVLFHPYQLMGSILVWAAICGFAGAKVFNALENWNEFMADPVGMLIGTSGLTFYGGLICGGAAVLYIAHKNGIKLLTMLDIGGPGMMLSYALGRIGCQMAGDGDWGIDNLTPKPHWLSWAPDWMWSFNYPHNVSNETVGNLIPNCVGKYCNVLIHPVFPTPFYETVACLILFAVLWSIRDRFKAPGVFFGVYLIMNGVERFLVELIRVNTKYIVMGIHFTQAELISLCLVLGGIILIVTGLNREKKTVSNTHG